MRMQRETPLMAGRIDPAPIAETLKALAHPIRLMIVQELVGGTKCVSDMEELLPAKQANISQHLAVLRNARLVDFAQDGALRCYYLARPKLVRDVLRLMARDEPAVKRTAHEIKMEMDRAERALARPAR
ncbi:MAG: ArsR/SmtB family transcription factor [Planctomycetota bacterium]